MPVLAFNPNLLPYCTVACLLQIPGVTLLFPRVEGFAVGGALPRRLPHTTTQYFWSTVLAAAPKFWFAVSEFWLISKNSLISFVISLTPWLILTLLLHFHEWVFCLSSGSLELILRFGFFVTHRYFSLCLRQLPAGQSPQLKPWHLLAHAGAMWIFATEGGSSSASNFPSLQSLGGSGGFQAPPEQDYDPQQAHMAVERPGMLLSFTNFLKTQGF